LTVFYLLSNSNIVASNDRKENIDFFKELYKMIASVELDMFI